MAISPGIINEIESVYIVKLGFTEVYIIFLISAQNIDCGYSLKPPRRGGSNEHPQSIFWAEMRKISEFFIWKFLLLFLVVRFSIYLNRRVFLMVMKFSTLLMLSSVYMSTTPFSKIQQWTQWSQRKRKYRRPTLTTESTKTQWPLRDLWIC